jgi:hypothetical protein
LFAAAYPTGTREVQDEMRKMFIALGGDDTPMVRRAAAKALGVSAATQSTCEPKADCSSRSPKRLLRCSRTTTSSTISSRCTANLRRTTRTRCDC